MKEEGVDAVRILIIEDHRKINDLLARFARQDGHEVDQAYDAESAFSLLAQKTFDAIVTDLMLPGAQGEDLIARVRAQSDVYIMVISAKIDVRERVDVLSLGADDYLTKPFSVEEAMVKLKNAAKRIEGRAPVIRSYAKGSLKIVPFRREVTANGALADLTGREYDVLWLLASHPGSVFSREQIIDSCFRDSEAFDRVIDAYVKNIRRKTGDDSADPKYIKTHYGVGYQFVGDADD